MPIDTITIYNKIAEMSINNLHFMRLLLKKTENCLQKTEKPEKVRRNSFVSGIFRSAVRRSYGLERILPGRRGCCRRFLLLFASDSQIIFADFHIAIMISYYKYYIMEIQGKARKPLCFKSCAHRRLSLAFHRRFSCFFAAEKV